MGITITEDEADKKFRGSGEARKDVVKRHAQDNRAADEFEARHLEVEQTAIRNPNKAKAYRLVSRVKDGEIIARRQGVGYKITDPDGETKLINGVVKDGAQIMGDLVLMETPVENYEKRREMRTKRWEHMSGARLEQAKDRMNKIARDGGLTGSHKDAIE